MGPKHKEVFMGNSTNYWPSKKAKGKQPIRYQEDIRVKIGGANPCERYVHTRQDYLVYNSK